MFVLYPMIQWMDIDYDILLYEPRHVITNNVAF